MTSMTSMTSIPRSLVRVVELMSTLRPWWALCGGWAVDAWIGEQTRDHVDIDIVTFAEDQGTVFERLSAWNLIARDALVDQETTGLWDAGVSSCRRTRTRTPTAMRSSRCSSTTIARRLGPQRRTADRRADLERHRAIGVGDSDGRSRHRPVLRRRRLLR
ncbi:MAG TPA: hypothetical protein VFA08_08200 [Actinomycetota bacterium]|nr:hypothetical protein [Actinomycetota bacterium]